MKSMPATLALLLLPLMAAAQAQTVWRCGADGRSYSDQPCAQGRALELPAARPAADVQAAQELAARDRRLADALTRERLQREAATRGSGLGGFPAQTAAVKPAAKAVATHKRRQARPAADADIWQATAPVSRRKKG